MLVTLELADGRRITNYPSRIKLANLDAMSKGELNETLLWVREGLIVVNTQSIVAMRKANECEEEHYRIHGE